MRHHKLTSSRFHLFVDVADVEVLRVLQPYDPKVAADALALAVTTVTDTNPEVTQLTKNQVCLRSAHSSHPLLMSSRSVTLSA